MKKIYHLINKLSSSYSGRRQQQQIGKLQLMSSCNLIKYLLSVNQSCFYILPIVYSTSFCLIQISIWLQGSFLYN